MVMNKNFEENLPYGRQCVNEDDIDAVVRVLKGDWLTMGPGVEAFERSFADYVGVPHAVSFSSGTAALHAAMHVAGVRAGDAVVVPPLTFAATSNSAIYCGGEPLFADISPETLCMSPDAAEKACAESTKPVKVIAPVSFAGYPADIEAFKKIAETHSATIVEDASHALGAHRGALKVGVEADMTTFSFHPVKHITTAEGGMVATRSPEFAESLKRFRSHGIVKDPGDFVRPYDGPWDNDMIELGYNYRLSEIACALGESQLRRIERFVSKRREIASLYREKLSHSDGVVLPPDHPGHSYHLFPICVAPSDRKRVFERLRANGIGVQVHYIPVYRHTYYARTYPQAAEKYPNAENFSAGTISLPIFPDMSGSDVDRVVLALMEALEK